MSKPVKNSASLPVYVEISEAIVREINAGQILIGERLPPERELAKSYGVTVTTLRKSLKLLAEQDVLERRQGSGNYVQSSGSNSSIYAFFRLELKGGGGLPKAQLISVKKMKKPATLPTFGSGQLAYRIRRLRFLDRTKVALEEIWLDGARAKKINEEQVSESLYHFYKSKLGFWITKVEDRVSVSKPPDWGKGYFEHDEASVYGYVERYSYDQEGACAEFSKTWFNPLSAQYISRIK